MADTTARRTPILVITRPMPAARAFLAEVARCVPGGVDALISPLMAIEPVLTELPEDPFHGVVFTSANGVAQAARLNLPTLPAFCVGERTAETASAAGFAATSASGDADSLVEMILSLRPPGPLLHLRGAHARGDIAARLSAAGLPCSDVIVYQQTESALTDAATVALHADRPVVLPLFSPRTVSILAKNAPFSAPLHVVAISAAVADAARALAPASLQIAAQPDGAAMVSATVHLVAALHLDRPVLERGDPPS